MQAGERAASRAHVGDGRPGGWPGASGRWAAGAEPCVRRRGRGCRWRTGDGRHAIGPKLDARAAPRRRVVAHRRARRRPPGWRMHCGFAGETLDTRPL